MKMFFWELNSCNEIYWFNIYLNILLKAKQANLFASWIIFNLEQTKLKYNSLMRLVKTGNICLDQEKQALSNFNIDKQS